MHQLSAPLAQPPPIAMAVLGDSLAYGLGALQRHGGLAELLHERLRAQRPGSTISNFAVPHSTMGDVLHHQVPQLHGLQADVVLLIAGANDLRFTRDTLTIARRFRALLQGVRRAAPCARVLVGGMPDVTRTVAVPPLFKPSVMRLCARLNDRMRDIAQELGDGFIDLFAFTSAPLCASMNYLCEDGFHPNDFGYAEIAQRAYPALAEIVERYFAS